MTNKGNVYTWGNNSYEQLGHCSKENVSLFKIPNDYREIVQVCTGFRCTVIMNDKREMFYFGNRIVNTNGEKRKIDLKDKNLEVSNNKKIFSSEIAFLLEQRFFDFLCDICRY